MFYFMLSCVTLGEMVKEKRLKQALRVLGAGGARLAPTERSETARRRWRLLGTDRAKRERRFKSLQTRQSLLLS